MGCVDFRPSRHSVLRADFVLEGPELEWTQAHPPSNPAHGQRKLWYVDMLGVLEAYARVPEQGGRCDAELDVVVAGAGPGSTCAARGLLPRVGELAPVRPGVRGQRDLRGGAAGSAKGQRVRSHGGGGAS